MGVEQFDARLQVLSVSDGPLCRFATEVPVIGQQGQQSLGGNHSDATPGGVTERIPHGFRFGRLVSQLAQTHTKGDIRVLALGDVGLDLVDVAGT